MSSPVLPIPVGLALLIAAVAPAQTRQLEPETQRQAYAYLAVSALAGSFGDVDGDGDLDAVTTFVDPWFQVFAVTLHRHQGGSWSTATLWSQQFVGTQGALARVQLTDLDGDSDLDVVLTLGPTAAAGARFFCFANDGSGSFGAPHTTTLPGVGSVQVLAMDADGDLDEDLVVATTTAAGAPEPLALWRHDGSFGFLLEPTAFPAQPAAAPASVDVDGDGDLDVVAIGAADALLAFDNQNAVFVGGAIAVVPAAYVIGADLDGDGDGDLVVQRRNGAVEPWIGDGSTFTPQQMASGGGLASGTPILVDIDADFDLDVACQIDGEVRLLRNDGSADFAVEVVAPATVCAAGDVDQDGKPDLLLQTTAGFSVAFSRPGGLIVDPVLLRRSNAAFPNGGSLEDVADFDGNHAVDLVQETSGQLFVRRNHGVGEWSTIVLPVPFEGPAARAVDVDGDGDEDIVVVDTYSPGGMQVFRNDGAFVFTALPVQAIPHAWILGTGDLDGDAFEDLILVVGFELQLVHGAANGVLTRTTIWTAGGDYGKGGIADFDGDHDLDILFKHVGNCAMLLANDGSGGFSLADPCAASLPAGATTGLTLVDIDGDGDTDLFSYGYGSGQLLIHDGGTFSAGPWLPGVQGASLLKPFFADWDGDGDMDMLQLGGPAQLWLNDGTGQFQDEADTRIWGSSFTAAGVADLDGDGDVEPLGASSMFHTRPLNHLRSATSLLRPTPGGQMQIRYAHEPGYAAGNAVCVPILSLDRRSSPLPVPGIDGTLQIDLTASALLPFLLLPVTTGIATSAFDIPNIPGLLGADLYAQGLVLTTKAAWTPAIHERVL